MSSSTWASFAWTQMWQVSLTIVVVAALVRLLGLRRPHLTYALWLVVLIKCVTPPLVSSPCGVFCWIPDGRDHRAELGDTEATQRAAAAATINFSAGNHHATAGGLRPLSANGQPRTASRRGTDAPLRRGSGGRLDSSHRQAQQTKPGSRMSAGTVWATLVGVWLGGTLAIMLAALVRLSSCWRTIRRSGCVQDDELHSYLQELMLRLGISRPVRLTITRGPVGPAIIGVLKPTLLLPSVVVRGKSPQELEPILAHELIHLRRGDLWVGVLQVMAQALWWFHPLVWLLNRGVTRVAERCCDEEVVAELGCDPSRYARSLLEVLELKQTLRPVPVFPGVRPLEVTSKRMERIMQLRQGCRKNTPWWCWLVTATAAVLLLPGAAWVASGADETGFTSDLLEAKTKLETRRFWLDGVLQRISDELGLEGNEARRYINLRVATIMHSASQPGEIQLPDNRVIWKRNRLIVRDTPKTLERIQQELETMQRFGFASVAFEINYISGPPEAINQVGRNWTLVPTEVPSEELPGPPHKSFAPLNRPLPEKDASPQGNARMTIEKHLPVMLEIMDKTRSAEAMQQIAGNEQMRLLQAPRVTLFNGQSATISDCVQRPFVVGINRGNPQVRVVIDGLVLRLRPVLRKQNKVWLDYDLTLSSIRSVETTDIFSRRNAEPITVQVPEVAKTRLESSIEFPLDQTLMIGGLKKKGQDGKEISMLITLRARRVSPDEQPEAETDVELQETRTGRLSFGVGVRSDAGVRGQIVVEEENFELDGERRLMSESLRKQLRLAQLVEEFNDKFRQKRYREAEVIAQSARVLDPESPVVENMIAKCRYVRGLPAESAKSPGERLPMINQKSAHECKPGGEPPADKEVLRVFESQLADEQGPPYFGTKSRKNVRIVKETIADYVDPPRHIPLVGAAQLHHTHYKCTVYFDEVVDIAWPVAAKVTKPKSAVVYINANHLHVE